MSWRHRIVTYLVIVCTYILCAPRGVIEVGIHFIVDRIRLIYFTLSATRATFRWGREVASSQHDISYFHGWKMRHCSSNQYWFMASTVEYPLKLPVAENRYRGAESHYWKSFESQKSSRIHECLSVVQYFWSQQYVWHAQIKIPKEEEKLNSVVDKSNNGKSLAFLMLWLSLLSLFEFRPFL